MPSIADQKKVLRLEVGGRLSQMSAEDRRIRSEKLADRLWAEKRFAESRQVFCYVSMPEETDTHGIIRRCLKEGKKVAVPRVVAQTGAIEARSIVKWEGAFVPGPFGILEPDPRLTDPADLTKIDCVIVPGLAFDADGRRLGRGKGYYDRFLAGLGRGAARIALAFECQRVECVPTEPHDETVDLVLYA
jgi:5-formyltetrahydrofolate cyclo-ligase